MGKGLEIPNTGYSNPIRIRAHHLLCMQGFQGYGYSREFKLNLEKLIQYLESHPYSKLEVVAEADTICRKCPHLKDGQCTISSKSITQMDLLVLEKLGLEEGKVEVARNLFYHVNKSINLKDKEDICRDCSWNDKCTWYLIPSSKK